MSAKGPVFPVAFDELAMIEDLARLGQGGAEALAELGREMQADRDAPTAGLAELDRALARVRGLRLHALGRRHVPLLARRRESAPRYERGTFVSCRVG